MDIMEKKKGAFILWFRSVETMNNSWWEEMQLTLASKIALSCSFSLNANDN